MHPECRQLLIETRLCVNTLENHRLVLALAGLGKRKTYIWITKDDSALSNLLTLMTKLPDREI